MTLTPGRRRRLGVFRKGGQDGFKAGFEEAAWELGWGGNAQFDRCFSSGLIFHIEVRADP